MTQQTLIEYFGAMKPALCLLIASFLSFDALAQKLRLATTNFPPFFSEDLPGEGPFSQLTRQAFAEAGYSVSIEFIPWARAVEWGKEGKIDGLMGAWLTPERTAFFAETASVMSNNLVFYRKRNSRTQFSSYKDIAKQQLWIGTVHGYAQPRGLIEAGVNFVYTTRDKQPFMLLSKGRIDLVVVDKAYGDVTLALPDMQSHSINIEQIEGVVERRDMYVLLSKHLSNADEITEAFNQGLGVLKKDGRFQKIVFEAMSGGSHNKLPQADLMMTPQ